MRFTLKDICKYFNVPHATFALSFLALSFLLALHFDGTLYTSIWVLFIPRWIWDASTFLGIITTLVFWHTKYHTHCNDDTDKHYFHSLLPHMFTTLLLISFELLVCINASLTFPVYWVVVAMPLYLISFYSILSIFCTMGSKRVFVVFYDIHIAFTWIQVLFIGLRVDNITTWHWRNVFIPSWIMLILDIPFYIILVLLIYKIRMNKIGGDAVKTRTRVQFWSFTILFPFYYLLILIFLILLTLKLEGTLNASFALTFIPLYIILLLLTFSSLIVNRSNPLWFGLRTSFFEGLIRLCPILQDIVNISYSPSARNEDRESLNNAANLQDNNELAVIPYNDILLPD